MENFLTINENIESEITVKKSKFICNLIKIEKQEEAEEQIKKIKKKNRQVLSIIKTYLFSSFERNIFNLSGFKLIPPNK